jgi:hypothetical protein
MVLGLTKHAESVSGVIAWGQKLLFPVGKASAAGIDLESAAGAWIRARSALAEGAPHRQPGRGGSIFQSVSTFS